MARTRNVNRVAIFLKRQNPTLDAPAHSASRSLCATLFSLHLLQYVDKDRHVAQLRTSESWRELKARIRGTEAGQIVVKLLPPLDYYGAALAAYPPVPRNQRERADQEERWMRAERF